MMKQQHLPFTVLKLYFLLTSFSIARLQQYLPFTVLKRSNTLKKSAAPTVATVLTVYGIET